MLLSTTIDKLIKDTLISIAAVFSFIVVAIAVSNIYSIWQYKPYPLIAENWESLRILSITYYGEIGEGHYERKIEINSVDQEELLSILRRYYAVRDMSNPNSFGMSETVWKIDILTPYEEYSTSSLTPKGVQNILDTLRSHYWGVQQIILGDPSFYFPWDATESKVGRIINDDKLISEISELLTRP